MKAFWGEVVGTLIMVFVGLATVANAVIVGTYTELWQVAAQWGLGLIVAIGIFGPVSGAHFNPAISLAFAATTDFPWKKVPAYIVAQCLGAFLGALAVYLYFSGEIANFEQVTGITRGSEAGIRSAMVFGEYFPNPAALEGNSELTSVGVWEAFLAEAGGTSILAAVIFLIIRIKQLPSWSIPVIIGTTLSILIYNFAPTSMAGFNPARDFMPRLLSSFLGWGRSVFSHNGLGWLTVF